MSRGHADSQVYWPAQNRIVQQQHLEHVWQVLGMQNVRLCIAMWPSVDVCTARQAGDKTKGSPVIAV